MVFFCFFLVAAGITYIIERTIPGANMTKAMLKRKYMEENRRKQLYNMTKVEDLQNEGTFDLNSPTSVNKGQGEMYDKESSPDLMGIGSPEGNLK